MRRVFLNPSSPQSAPWQPAICGQAFDQSLRNHAARHCVPAHTEQPTPARWVTMYSSKNESNTKTTRWSPRTRTQTRTRKQAPNHCLIFFATLVGESVSTLVGPLCGTLSCDTIVTLWDILAGHSCRLLRNTRAGLSWDTHVRHSRTQMYFGHIS